MRKEICSVCGASAPVSKGKFRFDQIGLPVILNNIYLVRCDCGNTDPIIGNVNDLMDVIARALVSKHLPLTGHEVRFLRKYLGKSAKEFAAGIGIDPSTLSRWENSQTNIGGSGERLVRLLTMALSPSLKDERPRTWQIVSEINEEPPKGKIPQLEVDVQTGNFQFV
jgi:DNA-binding transcriptional regulator YiaG